MSVVSARPTNPSIRLAGSGHGWLPKYSTSPTTDAGLLGDLAAYGVLERLPRLAEAGQRREAALRPDRLAAEQAALLVGARSPCGDDHDHGRVGARELRLPAVGAGQLVPGRPRLELAAAARAEPGRPQPLGQPERVEDQRRAPHRVAAEERQQAAQREPLVRLRLRRVRAGTTTANQVRPSRSPSSTAARPAPRPAAPSRPRRPAAGPGSRRRPAPGLAGSAQRSSSQASSVRRSPVRSCGSAASRRCG